jgi:hypothetical protein
VCVCVCVCVCVRACVSACAHTAQGHDVRVARSQQSRECFSVIEGARCDHNASSSDLPTRSEVNDSRFAVVFVVVDAGNAEIRAVAPHRHTTIANPHCFVKKTRGVSASVRSWRVSQRECGMTEGHRSAMVSGSGGAGAGAGSGGGRIYSAAQWWGWGSWQQWLWEWWLVVVATVVGS